MKVVGMDGLKRYHRKLTSILKSYTTKKEFDTHGHTTLSDIENRPTSANISGSGNGGMRTFKSIGETTEGSPNFDSHILHFDWDDESGLNSQMAIPASEDGSSLQYRTCKNDIWKEWITLLDSTNYTNYAPKYEVGTWDPLARLVNSEILNWYHGYEIEFEVTNGYIDHVLDLYKGDVWLDNLVATYNRYYKIGRLCYVTADFKLSDESQSVQGGELLGKFFLSSFGLPFNPRKFINVCFSGVPKDKRVSDTDVYRKNYENNYSCFNGTIIISDNDFYIGINSSPNSRFHFGMLYEITI